MFLQASPYTLSVLDLSSGINDWSRALAIAATQSLLSMSWGELPPISLSIEIADTAFCDVTSIILFSLDFAHVLKMGQICQVRTFTSEILTGKNLDPGG